MFEFILKLVDAVGRFAWAVLAVCLFVLFLPQKQAIKIGIAPLKEQHLGYWWILLVFSGVVCLGNLYPKVTQWIGQRKKKAKERKVILGHLASLDDYERTWIACCLDKNVQTLYAERSDPTANSLLNKGIVVRGSGSILKLPFHIRNFVWDYLKVHRDEFLPIGYKDNPEEARKVLEEFEESL